MSVLVLGGDDITSVKAVLYNFGFDDIVHWDGRRESVNDKSIPQKAECLVMLTNFLNHNTMKKFKAEAKKRGLPIVCAKRGASCVYCEICKLKDSCSLALNTNTNVHQDTLKKIFPAMAGGAA